MELACELETIARWGRCKGTLQVSTLDLVLPKHSISEMEEKKRYFLQRFQAARVVNMDRNKSGFQHGGEAEGGMAAGSMLCRGVPRLLPSLRTRTSLLGRGRGLEEA